MNKLKIFKTFIIIFAVIAIGATVYAQAYSSPLEVNVDLDVDEIVVLDAGGCNFNLGTLSVDSGETKSCTISAYANLLDGFFLTLAGTSNGLYDASITHAYAKLSTTDDEMSATSGNYDEEWGWRIDNATGYTGVQTDTDNGSNDFDAETCDLPTAGTSPCWHTVNVGDEKFIDESALVTAANGTFDLLVSAVTDNYVVEGTYQDTLTIKLTAN